MDGGTCGKLMNILLVEDDPHIAAFIKQVLRQESFGVTVTPSAEDALEKEMYDQCDLIIMDLRLHGRTGDWLLTNIRKKKCYTPVLVLSGIAHTGKKVELLNLGADDYLTKPFDASELIARINALYRRHLEKDNQDVSQYGEISFSRKQNKVIRGKKEIFLTKKEGGVLELLLQHRGQSVRTEDILIKVWQAKRGYHSNIVQATIRRLRNKVDSGFKHKLVRNIHGIGYMIACPKKVT